MTNDQTNPNNPELHLHNDPELARTLSLLDELARQDADAMPAGLESRVLDSISRTIAPSPIAIAEPALPKRASPIWSIRIAAAAVLATGTTLLIVAAEPWSSGTPETPDQRMALVSFEQNMDDFFALESLDDGQLAEAVTDWEIWAQSVDTDLDTTLTGFDWHESGLDDGAL